jgi:hypothetical protein
MPVCKFNCMFELGLDEETWHVNNERVYSMDEHKKQILLEFGDFACIDRFTNVANGIVYHLFHAPRICKTSKLPEELRYKVIRNLVELEDGLFAPFLRQRNICMWKVENDVWIECHKFTMSTFVDSIRVAAYRGTIFVLCQYLNGAPHLIKYIPNLNRWFVCSCLWKADWSYVHGILGIKEVNDMFFVALEGIDRTIYVLKYDVQYDRWVQSVQILSQPPNSVPTHYTFCAL